MIMKIRNYRIRITAQFIWIFVLLGIGFSVYKATNNVWLGVGATLFSWTNMPYDPK